MIPLELAIENVERDLDRQGASSNPARTTDTISLHCVVKAAKSNSKLTEQAAADSQTICRLQRELEALVVALEFYAKWTHQGGGTAKLALDKYRASQKT